MAISRQRLREIYNVVKDNGYQGDYESFEAKFSDHDNQNNYQYRLRVFATMRGHGATDAATYDDFMKSLQPQSLQSKPAQASQRQTPQAPRPTRPTQQSADSKPVANTEQAKADGNSTAPLPPVQQAPTTRQQTAAWKPTQAQKEVMAAELQRMTDDAVAGISGGSERVARVVQTTTPEWREQQRLAEQAARMAGADVSRPLGFPGAAADEAAKGGNGKAADSSEDVHNIFAPRTSPLVVGHKYDKDGNVKAIWQLGNGDVTTDRTQVEIAEFAARQARQADKFANRMKANGLNPAEAEDIQKQTSNDQFDVNHAELIKRKDTLEDELKELYNRREQEKQESTTKRRWWQEIGHAANAANRNMHPTPEREEFLLDATIRDKQAELISIERTLRRERQAASAADGNWFTNLFKGIGSALTDIDTYTFGVYSGSANKRINDAAKRGDYWRTKEQKQLLNTAAIAQEQQDQIGGLGIYDTGAFVGSMMFMPEMWTGAVAGKLISVPMGRLLFGKVPKAVVERMLPSMRFWKRAAMATGSGAANFAAFEGAGNVRQQLVKGGDFSVGDALHSTVRGAALGAATGVVGSLVGNVGDKVVKGVKSTPGKAVSWLGKHVVSAVAEGTIFAVPQYFDPKNTMDFWDVEAENISMIFGMKLGNKAMGTARWASSPMKASQRLKSLLKGDGKTTFSQRLRAAIEASPVKLTQTEHNEIAAYGYGSVEAMLRRQKGDIRDENGRRSVTADYADDVAGYDAINAFMSDPNVSEATRAKVYYIVTGHMLPMSSVTGWRVVENDGRYVVEAIGVDGRVVVRNTFDNRADVDVEVDKIRHQVELNSIEFGERALNKRCDDEILRAALKELYPNVHIDGFNNLYRRYKQGEDVGEQGRSMIDAVEAKARSEYNTYDDARPQGLRLRIAKETGIDIDEVVAKKYGDRSPDEQAALQRYLRELYGVKEQTERQASPIEATKRIEGGDDATMQDDTTPPQGGGGVPPQEEGGDSATPRGDSRQEAIAAMNKAYADAIDTFGENSEQYASALNEDPLSLLDSGTLNAEQEAAVLAFYNARERAQRAVADDAAAAVRSEVDSKAHRRSGVLMPATMRDGREVYVVQGDVVVNDDGSVNVGESSGFLIVADAKTGEYFSTAPKFISALGEAVDKQTAIDMALQQQAPKRQGGATGNEQSVAATAAIDDASDNGAMSSEQHLPTETTGTQEQTQEQSPAPQVVGNEDAAGGELTALQRIPVGEDGEPMFEQAENPEHGWDALVEYCEGDKDMAGQIAEQMAEKKSKEYAQAQKLKANGAGVAALKESIRQNKAKIEAAKAAHDFWRKVAAVENARKEAILAQQEAAARQAAAKRAAAEKAEREAREEAARQEREALEGIPEWHLDTPENARKRGARRFSGQLFTRQKPIQGVVGKEVEVKFSQQDLPKGRVVVIEASQLQPSHIQGQRNPMFFIEEAQPKNRAEAVSAFAAKEMAERIRPQEITGSATAYTGAPTVNTRGEVIQGNNRSDALRYLWENELPEQQQTYKQYLIDNAEQFGINPEAVNAMHQPVLVNMLDVDDAEAIRLGQMTAQDTESGGVERIKSKNVAQKLGEDMRTFANLLLKGDEDASFGQLVDRNGAEVLKWMAQRGAITSTQHQSAFDSKGNLTAEAKNDLQKVLYQAVFKGGSQQLEEMFDALPVKAQRAILSTAFRDMDSPLAGKMLPEIQASIAAFNQLMNDPTFADAKKIEKTLRAVEGFKRSIQLDDRLEQYRPADNFSNFALHLAAMYKANDMSQSALTSCFNQMYDLAQGKKAATFFEEADTTEYPLAEVIKQVLNIDYEPAKNGNNNVANGGADVALRNQDGQGGKPRSNEPPASGEQTQAGTEPTDSGAGTPDDSGGGGETQPIERYDNQGNPIDENGKLIVEQVSSIDEITDNDFTEPTRSIVLPTLPENVQRVLSTKGKPVIIKKNILGRNAIRHDELTPEMSRAILKEALYNPTLYGQNKPISRPNNWIVINVPDGKGNNKLVVLEVNDNKDNIEIVHWYEVGDRGLEKIKRQAEREGGQLLILPSESSEEAGALSGPTSSKPSDGKGNTLSGEKQEDETKSAENEQGSEEQSDKDSTNESTAAEQSAEAQPTAQQQSNAVGSLAEAYIRAQIEYDREQNGYIEGRIDKETHDSVSSELWQKRNAALSALEEALLALDDNELIAVGAADKRLNGIVELMLQDRRNSNALVAACEELLESQGAIAGKPNTRYKLADIIDKKSESPQLLGVYHDGGYAVATDTHVLVADKREYDAANDGKIIGLDGVEIDGKYPHWQVVMPKQVRAIGLDVKDMLGFIAGVKAKAKSLTPKRKPSDIYVLVNIGGNICTYRIDRLERFCKAAASLDAKLYIARRGGANNPLYAEGENGYAMIMPAEQPGEPPRNESGHYVYDKAVAIGEKEASVWSDNANTVEGKKPTDTIGAKSAENEAQETQPGAGDVDMLRRKWEAMKGKMPEGTVFIVEYNGRYYAFGDDATRVNAALIGKGDAARTDMVSLDEKQYEEALEVLDLKGFSVATHLVEDIKDVKQQKMSGGAAELTPQERALTDGLVGVLRGAGIETIADAEVGQQVLDAANGAGVRMQAMLGTLAKAANTIRGWLTNNTRNRVFVIELPEATKRMISRALGTDFNSHNITANGIAHAKKNHGVNGLKLTSESIPLRDADFELAPYIMVAPDYVVKGSTDISGRTSIQFCKRLSNGIVVVVEKEYKNSPDDMETITMWADKSSSKATNARRNDAPDTHVQNAILSTEDAAKIRNDAEMAIRNDDKLQLHKVYHGSGADFDAFDFSHMGEGEGNQAYGYGGYVTEVEGIGRTYAKAMAKNANQRGRLLWECKTKYVDLRDLKRWHANAEEELAERVKDLEERKQAGRDANEIKRYEYAIKLQQGIVDDYKQRLTEAEAAYDKAVRALSEFDKNNPESSILYTIEVPDDTGRNYLHWEKPVGEERAREIRERLYEHLVRNDDEGAYEDATSREMLQRELDAIGGAVSGADVYGTLSSYLGSDKAASEFLRDNGFVGVSYPAQFKTGGRTDKARNFVIFNESDMRITDKARFFRTPDGQAYGFTIGGRIYIDPRIATAETPIHEYAHLWAEALRRGNAKEWRNVVELMRKTPIWEEVKKSYPELKSDSEIAEEVLAHYSGRRGAERLRQEMRKAMDEAEGAVAKAEVANVFGRIGRALSKFWRSVADMLDIHYTSAEEVADRVLYDMLRGFNPKDAAGKGDAEIGDIVAKAKKLSDEEKPKADENKESGLRFRDGDARDVAQRMDDNNGTEVVRFVDFMRRGRLEQGESRYFHVGETGDILNEHGISGKITIGTSAVNSHHNEDKDHLDEKDWVEVIEKINEPVAITEYGDRGNSYRIYTIVEKNGKNICVGVDVNSVGRDVNITNIRTAFARDIANVLNERLVYPHSRSELETAIRKLSLRHNREVYPEQPYDAVNIRNNSETQAQNEENLLYRIREDEPPTKTGIGYKVFVLKDGKLYPPMVANPGGEATPIGVWLDADAAPVAGVTKTGRQQVKSGGKGTQGGSGKLAYRPGWHLGEIPYALQFNRINPKTGQRELFPANFVWAEVEYANDVDYQDEAMSYGMNKSGKFQHSLAGLPRLPKDGSYKYRTNPDPNTDDWIITGAMKVNRILKPSEVDAMVEAAGREPQQRQAGAITDEQVEALNAKVQRTMQDDRDMMRSTAEHIGAKLHTDINVIEDVNEIKHANAAAQERRRNAKGWYDPTTGEVVIVLPNHRDVADIEQTVLHEVVGHDGLRVLFPDEAKLNNALDELYRVSEDRIKATIDATAKRLYEAEVARIMELKRLEHQAKGEDANAYHYADMAEAYAEAAKHAEQHRRTATEEYGANLAGRIGKSGFEKMSAEELTFWGRLKAMLQKALDSLMRGMHIKSKRLWTDKEWAFVLHEAYKAKRRGYKHPSAVDIADTAIMRRKTGYGEAVSNDGKNKSSEPKPIGYSTFGNVYNQFKGKVLQAVKFLVNNESGDLLGVFHRNDVGDIDMVWGDEGGGLCHILNKHINDKDFPTVKDLVSRIEDIINKGEVDERHSNADKLVLVKDGYLVTIRRNVREKGIKIADKNWVLTAYNKNAPATTKAPVDGTYGSTAVAPGTSSDAKIPTLFDNNNASGENIGDGRANATDAELLRKQSEREIVNNKIDAATAIATGKDIKTVRQERRERDAERKRLAAEIYRKVLAGEINDVTLQQINEYINDSTPRNRYGRPLSQRLPQGVERALYARTPENRIDALFSRISESGSAANERAGASAGRERQAVEERKKKALELWAKASGNWHTDLSEFTGPDGFIDHGTDSDVYLSKDGKGVIKLSKGKPYGKRFRPDIDNIALFNYVFPNSAYRILGYGDFGKGFVRILQQPIVDFKNAIALSAEERMAYMDKLGFKPINDERTAFSNGEIIVSDLQKNNIVRDAAGNITVIDADCKLHTKDIGGKWDYPSTESDLPQRGDAAYDGDGRRDDSDALMYRDGEKSLEETITEMRVAAMQANEGNLQAKREAMRAIGGNLNHLRQAMARQREYDIATAKSVKDLAQILIDNGLLSDMAAIEVKGLLKATANAIGRQDISGQVKHVFDIMLRNHLRNQEADFAHLTSMRGSRVDARGIQVQGELDADGQMTLSVFNRAKGLKSNNPDEQGQYTQDSIEWYIGDAMDRMGSDNEQIASAAATEYAALVSAKTFIDGVTYHKNAEKLLRQELRKAEQEYKAGLIDKAKFDGIKASIEEAIQQEQMQRIEGYDDVMAQLGGVLGESVERAKAWREAQKEHVRSIQHLANSDMQGREGRGHKTDTRLQKLANNPLVRYVLSPLASLDQMLKMFGRKNANGEGYLWNYYMRGIMDSLDNEQLAKERYYSAMDEVAKQIFGKNKFTELYAIADKGPSMTVKYYDGVAEREYELPQQALMYLYAVDKMPMGRATNRRMGITDELMEQITQAITPQMRDFIDWVQEELLPELGKAADEVHQRMFGAHMDAIENYFPFVRDANAIKRQVENGMEARSNTRITLTTGAIKKRVASVAVWDMRNINFLDVLAKHVDEMVHWLSFAEMNRDLSTLQSYNRFHQQVLGMSSMYGAGEKLWSNFTKVCAIATDSYEPMRAAADKTAVQIAKGVTMGKISGRPFTALKQTLSLPAFFGDVDVRHLSRSLSTAGIEAMQWAWKNMPNFRKRILSRTIGDYRLKATEYDTKIMKAATYGMMPNIAVDAWTIAIGAHAKYLTSVNKYLQWGMDKEAAHRRAVQDAELCYNKSQQSSEGGFMAPVQVDHSWLTMVMMLFRNASTAYTRETLNSARNLRRITTGQADIDFMAKQWLRTMGKDEADWTEADWTQARKVAAQERATAVKRNGINLLMYGWILPWLWRIGGVAPSLLLLSDTHEKDGEVTDTLRSSMFGPIEGLAYGDVAADGLSLVANNAIDGEWSWDGLNKIGRSNPLSSDIAAVVKDMGRDWVVGVNDILNIVGATWTGVNPQTLTDWVAAIMDASDDRDTRNETALLVARLLNCPQSQLQKLYLEELDMNGKEASRLTPMELAERYAAYKSIREAPMTGWMRGADDKNSSADRARKVVLSAAKEQAKALVMTERNKALAEEYRAIDAERKAILKTAKTDRDAFKRQWKQFINRTDMKRFFRVNMLLRSMDDVIKQYVQSSNAEEMRKLEGDIKAIRDSLAAEAEKGSIRQ